MFNTQDIIKYGFKNCPVCNKPPMFFWYDTIYGIGCCDTGIMIPGTIDDMMNIWNQYASGIFKEYFPNGLGFVCNSKFNPKDYVFHPFNIKDFNYNKRTCNTMSEECWCNPKIEVCPNGYKLVIHNED